MILYAAGLRPRLLDYLPRAILFMFLDLVPMKKINYQPGSQNKVLVEAIVAKQAVGAIESLFLDSGAFTLYFREFKRNPGFYESQAFWRYIDDYAAFVKKFCKTIDHYANVDVLYNPDLSWKVLKYLESAHGLNPVPVLHYGTSLKWLDRHLEAGYTYIGFGGVGNVSKVMYAKWADAMFDSLCRSPSRLPSVKVHGFAMTSHRVLFRYPWWSVDSATWVKVGAYGGILMPRFRRGGFVLDESPYVVKVSDESPDRKRFDRHYSTMPTAGRKIVLAWLDHIGVALEGGDGVMTNHASRRKACLLYFEEVQKVIPPWPWPFRPTVCRRGLGLC